MIDVALSSIAPMLWLAPDNEGAARVLQESGDEPRRGKAGRRLMIVEDEMLVALDIERIVSESGYEVVAVVDNQADAVAQAERFAPDAILIDIRLRDGDGIAAAAAIQAERAVSVIFVSANINAGNLARIRALESAAVIRKPFLERELLAGLAQALQRPN